MKISICKVAPVELAGFEGSKPKLDKTGVSCLRSRGPGIQIQRRAAQSTGNLQIPRAGLSSRSHWHLRNHIQSGARPSIAIRVRLHRVKLTCFRTQASKTTEFNERSLKLAFSIRHSSKRNLRISDNLGRRGPLAECLREYLVRFWLPALSFSSWESAVS